MVFGGKKLISAYNVQNHTIELTKIWYFELHFFTIFETMQRRNSFYTWQKNCSGKRLFISLIFSQNASSFETKWYRVFICTLLFKNILEHRGNFVLPNLRQTVMYFPKLAHFKGFCLKFRQITQLSGCINMMYIW